MRVLIIADMEGVSGIVVWEQVNGGAPLYEEGRRLYTEEINAAVRGAKAAGAKEIVVVDCHGAGGGWNFNSLIPDLLDPDCEWVAHHAWGRYTELLEKGCDAVLLVGMHARAGTPDGVLCHTISTTTWRNLYFNGQAVGETGINAALCGHYNCPVLLVTGDEATCREAKELLGQKLTTVAVKHGLSRYSARQIPPVRARQMIEAGVRKALQDNGADREPLISLNFQTTESWSGQALDMTGQEARLLALPTISAAGKTNLSRAAGTLRFWFAPAWSSASLAGTGPGEEARLLEVGTWSSQGAVSWWSLAFDPEGATIRFVAQSQGQVTTSATRRWPREAL